MTGQQDDQLNIQISEEVAEGTYSNLVIITHSTTEFVLDFVRIMPGVPKANVKSRIIMTPENTKRFLNALENNLEQFEIVHGPIDTREVPPFPMNFGGPDAEA